MTDLPPFTELPPEDEADLAELADGRLERRRAVALEERAARDPALAGAIDVQRTALDAIQAARDGVTLPVGLRVRLEALETTAPVPRGQPGRRRFSGLHRGSIGLAGAAVASALVATVLVLSGGTPQAGDALAFAQRPATGQPQPDPGTPQLLRESVGGVRFPDYTAKFGWRPVGTRIDELDGRRTRTVFYARGGRRVAYTIIDGEALDPPGGEPVVREGVRLAVLGAGPGSSAVTWRRGGRTCVLSGDAVPVSTLLDLASWKGKGAVRF